MSAFRIGINEQDEDDLAFVERAEIVEADTMIEAIQVWKEHKLRCGFPQDPNFCTRLHAGKVLRRGPS